MKITEKKLVDGFTGITYGGTYCSDIEKTRIFWNYRTGRQDDGYNPVCNPERAYEITLDFDRVGTIELDETVDRSKIIKAEDAKWGRK